MLVGGVDEQKGGCNVSAKTYGSMAHARELVGELLGAIGSMDARGRNVWEGWPGT